MWLLHVEALGKDFEKPTTIIPTANPGGFGCMRKAAL
jgi:hypothetical protein